MDTLKDRLAELADGAPTGGAPAAELWARKSHVRDGLAHLRNQQSGGDRSAATA